LTISIKLIEIVVMWIHRQLFEATKQLLVRLDFFGKPPREDGDELFLSALSESDLRSRWRDGRSREARHP
jgi:hypothetical protein